MSSDKVLHIHGSSRDKESIIVGHGRDYGSYRDELEDDLPEPPDDLSSEEYEDWYDKVASDYSDDYSTMKAKDAAASAMLELWKNVPGIIAKNQTFFESLYDTRFIHIYGFSFSDVDLPYIGQVLNNVNIGEIDFEISYHKQNDKNRAEEIMALFPAPKSIKYIKLDEIMRFKELDLFDTDK